MPALALLGGSPPAVVALNAIDVERASLDTVHRQTGKSNNTTVENMPSSNVAIPTPLESQIGLEWPNTSLTALCSRRLLVLRSVGSRRSVLSSGHIIMLGLFHAAGAFAFLLGGKFRRSASLL